MDDKIEGQKEQKQRITKFVKKQPVYLNRHE